MVPTRNNRQGIRYGTAAPDVSGRGYYRLDCDDAKFNSATQATDVAFTGPVAQHLEPAHEAQARLLGVIWSSLTGN